jgi:hypothetical protein
LSFLCQCSRERWSPSQNRSGLSTRSIWRLWIFLDVKGRPSRLPAMTLDSAPQLALCAFLFTSSRPPVLTATPQQMTLFALAKTLGGTFRFWILDSPYSSRLTPHRITLSALANTFGGIVNPICFAAFRLITSSNFVGCSMGRSAGFAPLRILST